MSTAGRPVSDGVYSIVRGLFIVGCITNVILTFVPSVKVVQMGLFGRPTSEKFLSTFDLIQLNLQAGQSEGLVLLVIAIFASWIALAVMAITYERRVVFIAGGVVASFTLLLELFVPDDPNLEQVTSLAFAGYAADAFMLLGFLAKPPAP